MANSSLNLSSLDFDALKENFKTFLSTQSVFKDYDFSGSNINVLLDVMAYNSYLNSFYLNMVASEMFLDSAQKYDSVVSHAKELNYVPRSNKSSIAEINLTLDTLSMNGRMTLPKGTRFFGTNSNGNFTFTTNETKVLVSSNSTFTVSNLQIYEGDYFTDNYIVDYGLENQQFLITNKDVDISSITVNVIENTGATNTIFVKSETLFGLNSNSEIYFIQAAQNNQYEIVFGDGLFGRKPLNFSLVTVNYRLANGQNADGVTTFVLGDDIGPVNNGTIENNIITTVSNSSSGALQESIESIRFAAPRYFATQQRAVTSDDYSSLILNNFGGEISDVVVYGGQEVEPKLYGRVIVSVKPTSGIIVPNYIKNQITNYLQEYIALPNRILINDPDYTFCSVFSQIQYNKNVTTKTIEEIKLSGLNAIINYSKNNLEKFGNDLRYSRLVRDIDNADNSIISNDTELRIIKRINPNFNQKTSYKIFVGNVLYYDSTIYSDNEQHKKLHESEIDSRTTHATLISSRFTYNANDGKVYSLAFFEDDAEGNIILFAPIEEEILPIEKVGTIDYSNGEITLNDINVASYLNYISIYIRSRFKDIFASQNKIIVIDPADVNVSVIEKIE
jgi:hypothetical protein